MTEIDVWHPISLSDSIEPGSCAGAHLLGQELVIWRDEAGAAHVWEDRCPHRGMRLSFGFVRGDYIACLYHGWRYDPRGQCRFIPAHPDLDVPATIRVATYPCVERLGMLWVYSDRTVDAPPDLLVESREVTPVRSLYVDCEPAQVMRAVAARSENGGSAGVALVSLDAGGQDLLAGIQPFGPAKTALHIVLPGAAAARRGTAQHAAAAWAEQLRRTLEARTKATANDAGTHEAAP
jgi:nitrite reductase/ring-hydroxylating ferredoxin subunit